MTFTLLAVSPDTNEFGFVQSTSTPAVGDLCAALVPGRGVLTVQAAGSLSQRRLAIRLFKLGYSPEQVIAAFSEDSLIETRQFAVVDLFGKVAVRTGSEAWGWAGEQVGDGFVATANTVVGPEVVTAMAAAFHDSEGEDFGERLMKSLEAGRDAGGQPDGQTSSLIKVWHPRESALDLRVDVHPEPIGHLRKIFDWYKPLRPLYQSYSRDNSSWDLDSWGALHRAGHRAYPDGGGWTEADIDRREAQILATLTAEEAQALTGKSD